MRFPKVSLSAPLCLAMLVSGCGGQNRSHRVDSITGKTASETVRENRRHLLSIPGVKDVFAGDCGSDSCITVVVEKKTPVLNDEIPAMLETFRVQVVER